MINKKDEIPIIPASDIASLEKRIFLSVIKDIEDTETSFEQKVVMFDIMIEGFRIALYLLYEFEKTLEISEKVSELDKENKIKAYLHGLNDTIVDFNKLLDYTEYEKTIGTKLFDSMVEGAKFTLNIFAETDEEWGNPWNWNSEYITDTKSYFIGIRDALNKFSEIINYITDYLRTYALFCPDCGKMNIKQYIELFGYGINRISNTYPMEIETMANAINDIDLIRKREYISTEYLWKDIKTYVDNMKL